MTVTMFFASSNSTSAFHRTTAFLPPLPPSFSRHQLGHHQLHPPFHITAPFASISSSAKPTSKPKSTTYSKSSTTRRRARAPSVNTKNTNHHHHNNSNNNNNNSTTTATSKSKSRTSDNRRQVFHLFTQAKQAQRAGQLQNARALLHQCIQLDPRDSHSWLALARLESKAPIVYENKNINNNDSSTPAQAQKRAARTSAARRVFEQGLLHCPDNVHLLHAWAVHEHRSGDRHRARNLFSHALRIDPGNPYISHAWGLLEQSVGNVQRARDLYAKSAAKQPNTEICVAWGILEARDGRIEIARRIFKQAVSTATETSPSSSSNKHTDDSLSNAYREWAIIEERLGDLPKARELLAKSIAANPTNCSAYIALAKLEARRGGTNRAIELARAAAEVIAKPPASVFVAWGHIEMTNCRRYEEAKKVFARGLKLHPTDPALLMAFGTLEEKLGNINQARQLYKNSVSITPRAPTFVAWAILEQKQRHYDHARTLFEEAITADALHGAAYNAYGMMEAKIGNLKQARSVFERGVDAAACASLFHGFACFELRIARNISRARQLFKTGAAHSREDTSFVWHSWGMMELAEQNVQDARLIFRDALKRYPRNSHLLVGAAMAEAMCSIASSSSSSSSSLPTTTRNASSESQWKVCDVVGARELFKKAVAADPTHAHAWQTWGMFELRSGRKDAAVALFRRGLRLCPKHGALWQAWGVLETGRGAFDKARKLFSQGLEQCGCAEIHILQAWACLEVRSGNVNRARELLDMALQQEDQDHDHAAVWNAYGCVEARHGTLAKARLHFTTGLKRFPFHAPLYRAYGEMEMRIGNYETARELFENGLKIDPRHAPLYHALAKLEGMVGNLQGLAKLKQQAEVYFQSKDDAERAMEMGDNRDLATHVAAQAVGDAVQDNVVKYEQRSTPMELALDETMSSGQ